MKKFNLTNDEDYVFQRTKKGGMKLLFDGYNLIFQMQGTKIRDFSPANLSKIRLEIIDKEAGEIKYKMNGAYIIDDSSLTH